MNALFYLPGKRLPVANAAQRLRAVEDGLRPLPEVDRNRPDRAPSRAAAARGQAHGRTPPQPQRCHHRRAERADCAPRRHGPRLRWREEPQRTQAPCRCGHDGVGGVGGGGRLRQRKRRSKGPARVQKTAREGSQTRSRLRRQGLRRHARRTGPCAASDGCSASSDTKKATPRAASSQSRGAGSWSAPSAGSRAGGGWGARATSVAPKPAKR